MEELRLQLPGSSLLPPHLGLAWFWLLLAPWGCVCQLVPWWDCQTCVHQHPLALVDGNETRNRVIILQLSDHQPSGPRVPAQLAQCAAARTRTALANPKPPADNDKVDNTCAAADGLSCETPAAPPDRAAGAPIRQPKNSKRAHLRVPALQTPPKFHERTPRERKKKENCGGRREKKARNFGPPTVQAPPFRDPPFGAPPFGAPPFWAPPFWAR